MSGRGRILAIVLIVLGTVGTLWATGSAGNAQTIEAHWSLYERANNTDFVAGTVRIDAPNSVSGYEIVGLGAVGVNESLADFHYGGPDFNPPMPPIVTCGANFTLTSMNLSVSGAYPYAGCVFFIGVTNASPEGSMAVELGPLSDDIPVTCVGGTCLRTDLDVLAGGNTVEDITNYCRIYGTGPGGVVNSGGLRYEIFPGYTFVCPVFVTVLQPACEDCDYTFEVTREVPTPTESALLVENTPTETGTPRTNTPTATNTPVPPTATNTPVPPVPPTATITPIEAEEGVRTPGPEGTTSSVSVTPAPPSTGSGGVLVRYEQNEPPRVLPIFLVLLGVLLCLATAWPAAKRERPSPLLVEVAGSPVPSASISRISRIRNLFRGRRA